MSEKADKPLGYGLIGCGGFGLFCLEQYSRMDELRPVAVADAIPETARGAAEKFGLAFCASPAELLAREDVDIVHVATPPFTHRELGLEALAAGKHVLCEKPLAVTLEDAREMVEAARAAGRVLAANLIMRYDPLAAAVKRIIDEKLLGEPLHGFFENYAGDENLPPEHWFWAREKSGGIFVEHGVHFFDLFRWWLGEGRVVSAQETRRPGTEIVEQVGCTALYGDVTVNFYHGFHQPGRMDRQELRLIFERGSISLEEWIPTRARIDALADSATLQSLLDLVPKSAVVPLESYRGGRRRVAGRHQEFTADGRYQVVLETGMTKPELYGHVLRALMADQVAAVRDPGHGRLVDESGGVTSLEMAVGADRLAR